MPASFGQTALLIFSRTPSSEAMAKAFDPNAGKSGNRAIAQRLIRQTLAIAHRSQLPVFTYYDPGQTHQTFGEKLADALESVFNRGYDQVIALGNDCPDVSVPLLLEASRRLEAQQLVLGPTPDGGVYLIGIQQAAYQRQAFVDLPWETAQLQAGWKQYAAIHPVEMDWLEPFSDIDQASDFKALLARLPRWSGLRKQFLSILASFYRVASRTDQHFNSVPSIHLTPLRGPPTG